jgi:hypothetical protein
VKENYPDLEIKYCMIYLMWEKWKKKKWSENRRWASREGEVNPGELERVVGGEDIMKAQ